MCSAFIVIQDQFITYFFFVRKWNSWTCCGSTRSAAQWEHPLFVQLQRGSDWKKKDRMNRFEAYLKWDIVDVFRVLFVPQFLLIIHFWDAESLRSSELPNLLDVCTKCTLRTAPAALWMEECVRGSRSLSETDYSHFLLFCFEWN